MSSNYHGTKVSQIADLLNIHRFYFHGCWVIHIMYTLKSPLLPITRSQMQNMHYVSSLPIAPAPQIPQARTMQDSEAPLLQIAQMPSMGSPLQCHLTQLYHMKGVQVSLLTTTQPSLKQKQEVPLPNPPSCQIHITQPYHIQDPGPQAACHPATHHTEHGPWCHTLFYHRHRWMQVWRAFIIQN